MVSVSSPGSSVFFCLFHYYFSFLIVFFYLLLSSFFFRFAFLIMISLLLASGVWIVLSRAGAGYTCSRKVMVVVCNYFSRLS